MNQEFQELFDMQSFLGLNHERPITVYRREQDDRCDPGFEVWLTEYRKELKHQCKNKLAKDFLNNLGENLFKEKFSHFHQFHR